MRMTNYLFKFIWNLNNVFFFICYYLLFFYLMIINFFLSHWLELIITVLNRRIISDSMILFLF